ncbi:hypothetical protein CRYUN_Cryun28dG0076800 [Craigia yunnanensis]
MVDPDSTTRQDFAAATEPHPTQEPPPLPLTQRTRDVVIIHLVEKLSSQSVLSKRYETIPKEEASAAAKSIEDEAFSVAMASFSEDKDGIEIFQLYSKEISKRMLDIVKARAAAVVL